MNFEFDQEHLAFLDRNVAGRQWHYLKLHDSNMDLADDICRFLLPAFQPGHAAIVIATKEHIALVRERAPVLGIDLNGAQEREQFITLDARELLSHFMVNDMPDRDRFNDVVSGLLAQVASSHPHLHVYGEMVALLMSDGNTRATEMLEELWNSLGRAHPFALMCGYPRSAFGDPAMAELMERICNCHTHTIDGATAARA